MPIIVDDRGNRLIIKGRSGIILETENGSFEINSEMVVSDEYQIAVYSGDVVDSLDNPVCEKEILEKIEGLAFELLKQGGIKYKVF